MRICTRSQNVMCVCVRTLTPFTPSQILQKYLELQEALARVHRALGLDLPPLLAKLVEEGAARHKRVRMTEDLPADVAEHIFSLIQYPQPKHLLHDIVSFHQCRNLLVDLYSRQGGDTYELLRHDLIDYFNESTAFIHGRTDTYYEKCLRHPFFQTREDVDTYDLQFWGICVESSEENVRRVVNVCLGLLTSQERDNFIARQIKWSEDETGNV